MVIGDDIAVLRQDEAAARAYAGRFHAPEVGCDLRGNAADRADVHLIDLRRCKRLVALVGLERFRQGRPFEPVGGIALRFRRCGLLLLYGLLGHDADRGILFLLGEVFLPNGVDGLRQHGAADTRDDRHRGQQRCNLESGVLAAAPDLFFCLFQRRLRRFGRDRLKAVVHLFIVIFHGSALLFGVSVQKSGSGRSSIWLTRFNDSLRRIYGWKRKLISTKSGALPTSPIVVLHPACRMAARQAS